MIGLLVMNSMVVGCSSPQEVKKDTPVRVQTETVCPSDVNEQAGAYVGEVEAESSTAVSFTGSGTVVKVLVSEGQHVSKGQLIALMDETQNRNAMMAAEAMMTQAQDAYDRMKMLHESQSLSEMDWVEVQSKVQQARSSLEMTKKSLENCRLVAPCSGVIGSKMIEAGMTVLPAQPVCNILDISRVKVKISVPEKEVAQVAHKATISVDALGGECYESIDMERGVTADALSRTYEVRYLVNNHDGRLLPGMVCEVNVESGALSVERGGLSVERGRALTLPITAVQRGADGKMFVWTVRECHAHRTNVKVGKAQGNRIIIEDGIHVGDIVVTKGYQKLSEGRMIE